MIKDLVIIGAGGVGRETAQLIEDINNRSREWNLLGFIDDNISIHGNVINGYKVIGDVDYLNSYNKPVYAVCSISNSQIKKSIIEKLKNDYISYTVLIHPTAVISKHSNIGHDVIIQAFCFISTNVIIEDHVQLNPYCGIGHDAIIKEYSSLYWNVNISGFVRINKGCLLGTKSTVIQGLSIGEWAVIGSNANVINDIPERATAVGNPASVIKKQ